MKEADYEPEEGEIQDDDEPLDGSQPVLEDTELGKNKRSHVGSYSHHSVRGDTLHHRLLDPSMHPGERFRAAIMDWVAPSKSNSTRSTRYRDSIILSRHSTHSRHCVKEWNNVKSLGRSTQRDAHSRETHSTSSKSWFPTYSSKLPHERNNASNFADSGNNGLESSTRWSHYCKTLRGPDPKRKPTCDKSTNTMERRQKYFSHSRKHNCNNIQGNSKDNKSKSQVPDPIEKTDEPVKEPVSVPSPAKSDCSDVVEIINVPRKEPEVITIEDSEEEVDKISEIGRIEAITETNITKVTLQNNDSLFQTQLNSLEIPHSLNPEPVSCKEIDTNDQSINLTSQQSSNIENNDSALSPLASNTYVNICPEDVTNKENDVSKESLNQSSVLDNLILESICASDVQDKLADDSGLITCKIAPSDQLLEEVDQSAIPETQVTSELQTNNINIVPMSDDSAQVDNREIVPLNCTKHDSVSDLRTNINETSVTNVCLNKNFEIFSKENQLQYVSYWGNSICGNRDSKQNKKITSFSVGQVLTKRVYSDSSYTRQPQYATVYFDRIGTNNGKCNSYDGQKYRFSVKVPEFIINIGRDSDSGDDSDNKSDTDTKTDNTPSEQMTSKEGLQIPTPPSIPVDFEKKLDVWLKQARSQHEEKAQLIKDNIIANNNNTESSPSSEETINPCETVSSAAATSKEITSSEGCARVLPSLKNIASSKIAKAKSKISLIRNSYSNLTSDKYSGNGLYVKAAKKLVSKSIDLNKHLAQTRNRKFLSRSKVINQTCSIPSGVNIGLLSPLKQREYIKLKRKIIQLTHKSKEEQSVGKAKIISSAKMTAKENKTDETKSNKTLIKACTIRNNKVMSKEPHKDITSNIIGSKSSIPPATNGSEQSLKSAIDMESDSGTSWTISNTPSKSTHDNTVGEPIVDRHVTHIQKSNSVKDLKGKPQRTTDSISCPRSEEGKNVESDSGTSKKTSSKPSKSTNDNTIRDPTVNTRVTHIQKNNSVNDLIGEPQRSTDSFGSPSSDGAKNMESDPNTSRRISNKPSKSNKDSTIGNPSVNSHVTQKNISINVLSKDEPRRSTDSISSSRSDGAKIMEVDHGTSRRISNKPLKIIKVSTNSETTVNMQMTQKSNNSNDHSKCELRRNKDSLSNPKSDVGKNMRFPAKRHERNVSSERRHKSAKRQCIENTQHAEYTGEKINNTLMMKSKHSEQLWSTETKLIAKRREVLENISSVRLNLHKIEAVNFKRKQLIEEIQKLKEQLKQTEVHLMQKEEYLNMLNSRVEEAKQNIQRCQSELLSLTLECEEIGCKVDGPNYNIPNTCADLIRNEMAAMSEAIQLLEIQKSTMQS